ncbi:MAG: hypothetical protein ACW96S_04895 [Promethearchaeota archaeon]|jgi:hypothetical protein
MAENEKDFLWTVKIDWLNIVNKLNLNTINQIREDKKNKAIKRLTKIHGSDRLMSYEPEYLENLIVVELKELMKRELADNARDQKRMEKELREKIIPLRRGIIKLDPRDLKNFKGDPEKLFKDLYKKFLGEDSDDDDDEKDNYREDNTSYYI